MKKHLLLIGTGMIIAAAILCPVLFALKFPLIWCRTISIALGVVGFIIQMYSVFSVRHKFKKDIQKKNEDHQNLLKEIKDLPPDEAIDRLLKNMK